MTRTVKLIGALALVVVLVAVAGGAAVFAQQAFRPGGFGPGAFGPGGFGPGSFGPGMMGGRGGMMGYAGTPGATPEGGWGGMMGGRGGMMGAGGNYGGMMAVMSSIDPAAMHTAVAGALGMSLEDFQAAMAQGRTPYQIAQERGVEWSVVRDAMDAAMDDAVQAAVDAGKLTQEQAGWITQHHDQMLEYMDGNGGPGGMMGAGGGMMGGYNGGTCPHLGGTATPAP